MSYSLKTNSGSHILPSTHCLRNSALGIPNQQTDWIVSSLVFLSFVPGKSPHCTEEWHTNSRKWNWNTWTIPLINPEKLGSWANNNVIVNCVQVKWCSQSPTFHHKKTNVTNSQSVKLIWERHPVSGIIAGFVHYVAFRLPVSSVPDTLYLQPGHKTSATEERSIWNATHLKTQHSTYIFA
jgi:hypothetical protein